jgi:hypothetical protein
MGNAITGQRIPRLVAAGWRYAFGVLSGGVADNTQGGRFVHALPNRSLGLMVGSARPGRVYAREAVAAVSQFPA